MFVEGQCGDLACLAFLLALHRSPHRFFAVVGLVADHVDIFVAVFGLVVLLELLNSEADGTHDVEVVTLVALRDS